jgi:hypothetical protein
MQKAAAGLQRIMADALKRAPANEIPVLAWPVVAGATVAEKTRALDFAGGTLRVAVPDAGWQSQLMDLVPRYVAALNRMAAGAVERIIFVLPDARQEPRKA